MRIPATIASIAQATPTVKALKLDVGSHPFNFLPGQWVDCYLSPEGHDDVAGFSITSSPLTRGTIDLAVKLVGDNCVTRHLHESSEVGDVVYVEGGSGDFFYEREMGDSLVLIGGGIGITPLVSIVRYIDEAAQGVRVSLLYSASTPSELLFHDELLELASRDGAFSCHFTVTRRSEEPWNGAVGRISAKMLTDANVDLEALFYLCGPPPMIRDVLDLLRDLDVPDSRVKSEQWW